MRPAELAAAAPNRAVACGPGDGLVPEALDAAAGTLAELRELDGDKSRGCCDDNRNQDECSDCWVTAVHSQNTKNGDMLELRDVKGEKKDASRSMIPRRSVFWQRGGLAALGRFDHERKPCC